MTKPTRHEVIGDSYGRYLVPTPAPETGGAYRDSGYGPWPSYDAADRAARRMRKDWIIVRVEGTHDEGAK